MKLTEGRWLIVTATSQYTVDIDEGWLIRKPGTGPLANDGRHQVTEMIRDGDKVGLNPDRDVVVNVGQSAVFYTTIFPEGWRMTTQVQQIWSLDPKTGEAGSGQFLSGTSGETEVYEVLG